MTALEVYGFFGFVFFLFLTLSSLSRLPFLITSLKVDVKICFHSLT